MTNFVYKGLSRNPEIGNTPAQILCNIWRLKGVRDTKFDRNLSNGKLFNAAKCRGSEFSNNEIELQNRVTENNVTLQVTNSEIFIEILLSSY